MSRFGIFVSWNFHAAYKQFAVAVMMLMGSVGMLLLVCANIAWLILARGEAARREIAVWLSPAQRVLQ